MQIILLYFLTLVKQGYLLICEPFSERRENILAIVNEGLVTASLFLYTGLALNETLEIQKVMGFGIISMVILSIAINVGILVWRVTVE